MAYVHELFRPQMGPLRLDSEELEGLELRA